MLQFQGEKELPLPPAELWTRMSDARFLVQCIQGVETVTVAVPERAVCTQRPGFSFARGTLELTINVAELVPSESIKLILASKGIGSSSTVEVKVNFAASETGTRLLYQAEITHLGGLLKAVPHGLIRGAAARVIADTWNGVEKKLAEDTAG